MKSLILTLVLTLGCAPSEPPVDQIAEYHRSQIPVYNNATTEPAQNWYTKQQEVRRELRRKEWDANYEYYIRQGYSHDEAVYLATQATPQY